MGATFDSVRMAPCSPAELKTKFSELQEDYCQENGSDTYAGHIGIAPGLDITSKTFKDSKSAEEWLLENATKWEDALAVKVGEFNNVFPKTEGDKKLATSFAEISATVTNWDNDIIKRVKSGKSQQRACPKCASKITVSYIKTNSCPVCHDKSFLQTDTDSKKLAVVQKKYNDLQKKVAEAKQKYAEKNKDTYWLIGAWCAE